MKHVEERAAAANGFSARVARRGCAEQNPAPPPRPPRPPLAPSYPLTLFSPAEADLALGLIRRPTRQRSADLRERERERESATSLPSVPPQERYLRQVNDRNPLERYRAPTIVFGFVETADDVNTRPNISAFAILRLVAASRFALKSHEDVSDE